MAKTEKGRGNAVIERCTISFKGIKPTAKKQEKIINGTSCSIKIAKINVALSRLSRRKF